MKDQFKPGEIVWCIKKKGLKHYMVWATKIQGIQFTQDEGFQYVLETGGPFNPKDIFQATAPQFVKDSPEQEAEEDRLYALVKAEAEKRWAMEKEESKLIAPSSSGIVMPTKMFG